MKKSQSRGLLGALFCALVATISTAQAAAMKTVSISLAGGEKAILAYQNPLEKSWQKNHLAPRGSTALTPSGDLAATGIHSILHAATGSMGAYDASTEPTIQSIRDSIILSLKLAEKVGIKKVAVPLIGGGIFLDRLGVSKERLAYEIIDAARLADAKVHVAFVTYTDEETESMKSAYDKAQQDANLNWLQRVLKWFKSLFVSQSSPNSNFFKQSILVKGSITDFHAHGASAIINAANMELEFGGGLSGVIGRATGATDEINQIGRQLINALYSRNSL